MQYWTWGEIREKLENEFDIQEEPDILASGEMLGYLNDAIDLVEQHFIKLPDYFFSVSAAIPITAGTQDYALPTDIYANKIRKIFIDNQYELKALRDLRHIPLLKQESGTSYRYKILNIAGSAPVIRLYPTPTQSGTMEIYYTRNATRITGTSDSQEIDVPEAMNYILEYMRMRMYGKEKQFQSMMDCKDNLVKLELMLIDALAVQIDDENNEIMPDMELYEAHQ